MGLQLTKIVQIAPPFQLTIATVLSTRNTAKLPARPFSNRLETRAFDSKLPARPFDTRLEI